MGPWLGVRCAPAEARRRELRFADQTLGFRAGHYLAVAERHRRLLVESACTNARRESEVVGHDEAPLRRALRYLGAAMVAVGRRLQGGPPFPPRPVLRPSAQARGGERQVVPAEFRERRESVGTRPARSRD